MFFGEEFKKMEELAAKYVDYQQGLISEIEWREPDSPEQLEKIKQTINQRAKQSVTACFGVSAIFTFVFLILTILSQDMPFLLSMGMITTIVALLTDSIYTLKKAKKDCNKEFRIATGYAIWKYGAINQKTWSGQKSLDRISITFLPDNGSKIYYKNIAMYITRKDFYYLTDKTPIVVYNYDGHIGACVIK